MKIREDVVAAIQAGGVDSVHSSEEMCQTYASNFGGTARQLPLVVVKARREEDILHTLQIAQQAELPVSIRGSGHSFGNQGLCDGGILIANVSDEPELVLLEDGCVEVTTRTRWGRLEPALNELGRAMPVLTSELGVSVGGTLAVGGYGEGTVAYKGQIDLVQRLKLIKPDGSVVWCSPTENEELFRYSLASVGQVGFVERVVLRTIPYQKKTRIYINRFQTLPNLINSVLWMADRNQQHVDFFAGQHFNGMFIGTYGVRERTPAPVLPDNSSPLFGNGSDTEVTEINDWPLRALHEKRRNQWDPNYYYIWTDYVVDLSQAQQFASFVTRRIVSDPSYARYFGRTLLLVVRQPEEKQYFPFEPVTPAMSGLAVGFGLYFRVPKTDAQGLSDIQALQRRCLEQCLEMGGRPYLAGWHELTEEVKHAIYGSSYQTLQRLRRELDPHNRFNTMSFS